MPTHIRSIAESVKESPRLASIQDAERLYQVLKTRYNSELEAWQKLGSKEPWKAGMIRLEQEIRSLKNRIQALEAEVW